MSDIIAPGCISTHGGMGYAIGSYWRGDKVVCGFCGAEISNPHPTGGRTVYPSAPERHGFFSWLWWRLGLAKSIRLRDWTPVSGQPPAETLRSGGKK